jgi:chitinase
VTVITTITVSAFTISYVPFWAVTIASDDGTDLTAFTPVQSITPPSIIFSLPGDETLSRIPSFTYVPWLTTTVGEVITATPTPIQNGTVAECTFFYQVEPGDNCTSIAAAVSIRLDTFVQWNPAVNADCNGLIVGDWYCKFLTFVSELRSVALTIHLFISSGVAVVQNVTQTPIPPVYLTTPSFYSTSHLVTIQPPPTVSFTFTPLPLTFSATPSPVSSSGPCDGIIKAAACGAASCAIFGCSGSTRGCGIFGCDGDCGITFCGGGCALLGSGPGCGEGRR